MHDTEKRIYWIRHAQPEYPQGKRTCLGRRVDVPLSEEGRRLAQQLGKGFAHLTPEAIYTSPLLRARQTAEKIGAGKCSVVPMEALEELDGGVWDGLAFEEIHARYPQYFIPGEAVPPPPGGESDEAGLVRVREALEQIERQTTRCAVVVSHSGISRILLASLMDIPLRKKKRIHQAYGCVSVLRFSRGLWHVEEAGIEPEEWLRRGNDIDDPLKDRMV